MTPLSAEARKNILDRLTANVGGPDNAPWKQKTVAALNALGDEALLVYDECLKAHNGRVLVNAEGFTDGHGNRHRPLGNGQWETTTAKPAEGKAKDDQKIVVNCTDAPKSMIEYLDRHGSPAEREAWGVVMNLNAKEKGALLSELVGNLDGGIREEALNRYKDMTIADLQTEVAIRRAQNPTPRQQAAPPVYNFAGAGVPAHLYQPISEEPLPETSYDWGKQAG